MNLGIVREMTSQKPLTTKEQKISDVSTYGKRFAGKKEYLEILRGQHSTPRKRVLAMCYECMGYYEDGPADCEQIDCPLHGMMPYRKGRKVKKKKEE